MPQPIINITDSQQALQVLTDLNSKLTEEEKDHPGTAWYLSQLSKLATNVKEK